MWKTDLKNNLKCSLLEEGKELAPLSALGAGGRGELFVEPTELRDISELFRIRSGENFPLYILGGGTNVVFADGDLEGVVLSTRRLKGWRWDIDGTNAVLEAETGCLLPRVVSYTSKEGFTGAEFAYGIPGTVGGAVAGNAGTGGESVGDLLEEVTTVEERGDVRKWGRGEFGYSYRHFSLFSSFPPVRFLASCKMKFRRGSPFEIERKIELFRRTRSSQPRDAKSAGCAFKNPPGDSAGRLLDVSGCKGLCVGGAVVSELHANFVLNGNNATGADIFRLMESCRDIVFQKTGVRLEPEVKLLGFETGL
ncbi:MAG: UDP-N-acetylmuramate dehydrogenase [Synergistaceae bacterium]|jgi:UDP-N-acetylmuramate dehydrogenase|nr:UDP-N-acetylmuramate dehydrogenase [Synergistaceae bacterium]